MDEGEIDGGWILKLRFFLLILSRQEVNFLEYG